jgi:hypothetical protein
VQEQFSDASAERWLTHPFNETWHFKVSTVQFITHLHSTAGVMCGEYGEYARHHPTRDKKITNGYRRSGTA